MEMQSKKKEKLFLQYRVNDDDDDYYEYINKFVSEHLKKDSWNETQLYTIVETIVSFIDEYAETFMQQGYPGDAVWIFEQLCKINTYVKKNGLEEDDSTLEEIEEPFVAYRTRMADGAHQPLWLSRTDFINLMTQAYQLAIGLFTSLKLKNLQSEQYFFSPIKKQQAHEIVDTLLTAAILEIKKTPTYKKAESSGHLYYISQTVLTKPEERKIHSAPARLPSPLAMATAVSPRASSSSTSLQESSSVFFSSTSSSAGTVYKSSDAKDVLKQKEKSDTPKTDEAQSTNTTKTDTAPTSSSTLSSTGF